MRTSPINARFPAAWLSDRLVQTSARVHGRGRYFPRPSKSRGQHQFLINCADAKLLRFSRRFDLNRLILPENRPLITLIGSESNFINVDLPAPFSFSGGMNFTGPFKVDIIKRVNARKAFVDMRHFEKWLLYHKNVSGLD